MSAEEKEQQIPKRVPDVPGVFGLGWMLFMQPIRLHYALKLWGVEGDPSLIEMWPRIRARDPVVLKLVGRFSVLLFVVMPLVAFGIAAISELAGLQVSWGGVARIVATGVAFGVALGVAGGVALGVALGVAFGVAFGVAIGVALGGVGGGGRSVTLTTGIVTGVVRGGVAGGVAGVIALGVAVGVTRGVIRGVVLGFDEGVWMVVPLVRFPLWPFEAIFTLTLSRLADLNSKYIPTLARVLPFRLHDLIPLPLPGLQSFLQKTADTHPDLARTLIAEAAVYKPQQAIIARVNAELQARELERAARDRLFLRAAALDFSFLPSEAALEQESPLRLFQSAALDLDAGKDDQRQRLLALERARKTMEALLNRTASSSKPSALENRLQSTGRLWLDVIKDEQHRLAAEAAANPKIPRAFIAGPPLSPDRIENQPLFKGRKDLAKLISHDLDPERRGVLVVVGQRRMGKSSLRNWLPTLLGTGTAVLSADFQSLSGNAFREHPHRWLVDLVAKAVPNAPPPPESDRWGESLAWLQNLDADTKKIGDKNILLVIDEVERVEDGIRAGWCSTDFLDFLRAAGDSLRHIRILLLTAFPLHRLGAHWVDRLISATTRPLSYLNQEDAEELIRAPIPDFPDIYPEGGVARILHETHGHPFLVQKTCDELCKLLNAGEGRKKATIDELETVLDTVVEEKLFDELWNQRTAEEKQALLALASAEAPLRVDTAMRALSREGIVVLAKDHATLAVPLFAGWIRLTQGAA